MNDQNSLSNQEWEFTSSASTIGKYFIWHLPCESLCIMPYHSRVKGERIYHCVSCKKKAPNHIILQANILNGD